MIIDRVFTPGLAQVAYMVADESAGEVAVIDPRRDAEVYRQWAVDRGFRIVAILETHVHADFVSGVLELAAVTGASIYTSRLGDQLFPHLSLNNGDEVPIGDLTLRAAWTPGHTPEHLSYTVVDPVQGPEPVALFSGDTLFVGEVGRPDLLGEGKTQYLAEQLFQTLFERLASLDDAVVVYPGHTAGSACGKKIGDAPHTTMGQERLFNYAFQAKTKQAFGHLVLDNLPTPPTYYPVLKSLNKTGAPLLSTLLEAQPFSPDQVAARQQEGALVIDTRSPAAFGQGHIPGANFAGLDPNFTTWMGWLAPFDRDLILVLDDAGRFLEAQVELRRIGLDRIAGYLGGGMTAWIDAGRDVTTLTQVTVHDLAERLVKTPGEFEVLDVRSDDEWNDGHVAGADHLFAGTIVQGADPPIDREAPVAVVCGSGYRSSVVLSVLQARGYDNLVNVTGGMEAWNKAGLPVTNSTPG